MPDTTTLSDFRPAAPVPSASTPRAVIDTLNNLVETCADGAYGFASCADYSNISRHRSLFRQRACDYDEAGAQLRALVLRLGGQPARTGATTGMLHRGWVAVRGTLRGLRDQSLLAECERGETVALERYRDAIAQPLPHEARTLVQQHSRAIKNSLAQMRVLREAYKALA